MSPSKHDNPRLVFLGDEVATAQPDRARAMLLPVPYEHTVSWKGGTARGPEMIVRASPYLEFYDEQLDSEPWRWGIATDEALDVAGVDCATMLDRVERRFGALMDAGHWVLMLGGEHSITPGGVRAAARRHEGLVVVQLDAHADLRDVFEGDRLSHACAMARCIDHAGAAVRAVGIRSYTVEEAARIRAGIPGYRIVHAWEMDRAGWEASILEGLEGRPVYLTFDVDYFDPSVIPATGTPEPGGGQWYPTLAFLEKLFATANVVACDVVELAPRDELFHADFTVARLVYKLIGLAQKNDAKA